MHINADYPPPKSWDQFEELCADIFQAQWSDPAMVRHGRAGQRQHGVDIVGRNGSMYPVALQCKKKSAWPVSRLTIAQIDAEVKAAKAFTPALKAFYILTTAPDDAPTLAHVRKLNVAQAKSKSFEVVLLGWSEIVRRATLHPKVADKHFGARGGVKRSPLHRVFYLQGGRLEGKAPELRLAMRELMQDFRDIPDGHVVVRQRESDTLAEQIAALGSPPRTKKDRKERIRLRDELQKLVRREKWAAEGVRFMLTDPDMKAWLIDIWEPEVAVDCLLGYLNQIAGLSAPAPPDALYLRLTPPQDPTDRTSALLSPKLLKELLDKMAWRRSQYGSDCTDTVSELPDPLISSVAVPRIVRDIFEQHEESGIPMDVLRKQGRFDLGKWAISVA